MKKATIILSVLFSMLIFLGCTSSTSEAKQDNVVYVNSLEVVEQYKNIDIIKGDTFTLNTDVVIVSPANANTFFVTIDNEDIVSYNSVDNIISAIDIGTTEVYIEYYTDATTKTYTSFEVNVLSKSIFAQKFDDRTLTNVDINIDQTFNIYDNVYINLYGDDTALSLNAYNLDSYITLDYFNGDIITLDELTGDLTVNTKGDTYVDIYVQSSLVDYISIRIFFTCTDNIYAVDFDIEGIQSTRLDNGDKTANITLMEGQSLQLDYNITTFSNVNYNLPIELVRNSENIVIDSQGVINAIQASIDNYVAIKLQSGKNDFITYHLYIDIVPYVELEIELYDSDMNIVDSVYEGQNYYLNINSDQIDIREHYDALISNNNSNSMQLTIDNNNIIASFVADENNGIYQQIQLSLTVDTQLGEVAFDSNVIVIEVYGKVVDYEYVAWSNIGYLNVENNSIDLYAVLKSDEVYDVATYVEVSILTIGNYNVDVYNYEVYVQYNDEFIRAYDYELIDNAITMQDNVICYNPTSIGDIIIKIQDKASSYSKTLTIHTLETYATDYVLSNKQESVYLILNDDNNNSLSLSEFSSVPSYAYNQNFAFDIQDSDIAYIENGLIKASGVGNTVLEVYYNDNMFKQIDIEVSAHANNIIAKYNLDIIYNNELKVYGKDSLINLDIYSYYNEVQLYDKVMQYTVYDATGQVESQGQFINRLSINIGYYGVTTLNITNENGLNQNIVIYSYEPIYSLTFELNSPNNTVNLYETNNFTNKIIVNDGSENYDNSLITLEVVDYSEYIFIDEYGNITIDESLLQFNSVIETTIKVGVIGDEAISASYGLTIIYAEPLTDISSMEYNDSVVDINAYDNVEIENVLNIILNDSRYDYDASVLSVSASDYTYIEQLSLHNVVLNDNVTNITDGASITITATAQYEHYNITASYVINIVYILPYDNVTSISFNNETIKANNEHNEDIEVNNTLLINDNNAGVYDLSGLLISSDINVDISVVDMVITVTTSYVGVINITATLSDISACYSIVITDYIAIDSQAQLYAINEQENYILTQDITLSNAFTISSFDGVLDGNGYGIYNMSTNLFNILDVNAVIKNINLNVNINNGYSDNLSILAYANLGTIENVSVTGDITITLSQAKKVGGLVYYNGYDGQDVYNALATISQVNYNATQQYITMPSSSTYASAISYSNYGIITNVNIGHNNGDNYELSEFINFKYIAGVAIYNYGTISYTQSYIKAVSDNGDKIIVNGVSYKGRAYYVDDELYQYTFSNIEVYVEVKVYGDDITEPEIYDFIKQGTSSGVEQDIVIHEKQVYYNDIIQ